MYRIKKIKKDKKTILVLDNSTSYYIKYCLPKNTSYEEISVRNNFNIIITFNFFFHFLINFIRTKKIILSSILAVCKIKKTKVIISFTDNTPLIGKIHSYRKDINCISIQNGMRSSKDFHGWKSIEYFPKLYGFGEFELDLLKKLNKNYNSYKAVGSLKYGIFKTFHNNIQEPIIKENISYISTWKDQNWFNQAKGYSNLSQVLDACKKLNFNFKIVLRYTEGSKLNHKEKQFYNSIIDSSSDLFTNNIHDLGSYKFCEKSNIIVTFASTLGYELYGYGKKVIFLGLLDTFTSETNNIFSESFEKLPEFIKVNSSELSKLNEKITYLDNLSESEYLDLTKVSRKYYMHYQEKKAHEIVKSDIAKFLDIHYN